MAAVVRPCPIYNVKDKKTYEQIRFDEKFALGYFVEQCFGFVFNEVIKAKSGWR